MLDIRSGRKGGMLYGWWKSRKAAERNQENRVREAMRTTMHTAGDMRLLRVRPQDVDEMVQADLWAGLFPSLRSKEVWRQDFPPKDAIQAGRKVG